MGDEHVDRVTRLEVIVDLHNREIKELKEGSATMSIALMKIEKNLNQIKWMCAGAVVMYLVMGMGVQEFIKHIF